MNLRTSERRQARIKMALQAPSGAGKTYSSLLIAYGITNDWGKIANEDKVVANDSSGKNTNEAPSTFDFVYKASLLN